MSITSGIGCTIALLFIWIFRYEVLKFGILFSVLGILWLGGRWYGQVTVLQREQELVAQGRLYPGQALPPHAQREEREMQRQEQLRAAYRQRERDERRNREEHDLRGRQMMQQQRAEEERRQQLLRGLQPQQYVVAQGPFPG